MGNIFSTMKQWALDNGHEWGDAPDREWISDQSAAAVPALDYCYPLPLVSPVDAYHPRDCGLSAGHTHLIANYDFTVGRLIRKAGQVLCTTKRHWGLYSSDYSVTCKRCQEIAARYGILYAGGMFSQEQG